MLQVGNEETLVLPVELGRNQLQRAHNPHLFLFVVLRRIMLVFDDDGLLLYDHFADVMRVYVCLNGLWHPSDDKIEPQQFHQAVMCRTWNFLARLALPLHQGNHVIRHTTSLCKLTKIKGVHLDLAKIAYRRRPHILELYSQQ